MAGLLSPEEEIKQALAVAREVEAQHTRKEADAVAMRNLRASLDALASGKKAIELTRPNVFALLQVLADGLRPATEVAIGVMPDDVRLVVTDHPAIALLDNLVGALNDLDNGKTHETLKPSPYGAKASLTAEEIRERDALLQTVDIVQYRYKLKSRAAAEKKLALELKKRGKKYGGKPVTAQMLKSWRDRRDLRK